MKKIVISIIAILTVVAVANTTFATSVLDDLNELKTNNNTTINNPKKRKIQSFASKPIPLKPCKTAYVYTAHVINRIIIVTTVRLIVIPNKSTIIVAISGVATENVVAVPANNAKSAKRSIRRPRTPSACLPIIGRHASEYL